MSDNVSPGRQQVGLCDVCRHQRVVVSQKGSRFVLCERSRAEPHYARYPSLPVLRCPGFEEHDRAAKS